MKTGLSLLDAYTEDSEKKLKVSLGIKIYKFWLSILELLPDYLLGGR